MKIEFKKIPYDGINFEVKKEDISFLGIAQKINKNLVKCTGIMKGSFLHICDRCGDEFTKSIKQNVEIYASCGLYDDDKYINLIEFFDDFIDFDTMLQSELESFKCDYLYCNSCNK